MGLAPRPAGELNEGGPKAGVVAKVPRFVPPNVGVELEPTNNPAVGGFETNEGGVVDAANEGGVVLETNEGGFELKAGGFVPKVGVEFAANEAGALKTGVGLLAPNVGVEFAPKVAGVEPNPGVAELLPNEGGVVELNAGGLVPKVGVEPNTVVGGFDPNEGGVAPNAT